MRNVRMTICGMMVGVLAVISIASADTFGTGDNQFTIDFVNISGDANPASGYGIVNNDYRMGTYEITNDQWTKFVNSYGTVTGSPSIAYDESAYWTGTDVPTGGVSWYEGAQFVNYLNTSTGHQAAYKFTGTQGTGDYTLGVWESGDVGYDSSNPYRNSNAYYFLPTEDEWVKAAYWNGTSLQTYAIKPGDTLYQGNGSNGGWNYYDDRYATDPNGPWDVGSGSEELNGTFDMMGNVRELMESPYSSGDYLSGSDRGYRSGSYFFNDDFLSSSDRFGYNPDFEGDILGFRVASVPEPTTLLLLSPNDSEELIAETSFSVTWDTEGTVQNVVIEYSTNNGSDWTTIATVENTGSHEWNVPNINSDQCLIRITDTEDSLISDTSDAVFTIFECDLPIPGDVNGDCYVNLGDIAIIALNWLKCGNPFDPLCKDDPRFVGHWNFNEQDGDTAYDSSGYENNGILINGPVWSLGKFDGSLSFDGDDTAVEVPTAGMDAGGGTVSLWLYANSFYNSYHFIFGHATHTQPWSNRIQLYMDSSGNLNLGMGDNANLRPNIHTLGINTWYHIALTWDGTDYVVYVNGIAKAAGTHTGLGSLESYADIGNNGNRATRHYSFDGLIDEVRIYSRALSESEIQRLYAGMVWVYIDDPGVPGHEGFAGEMSKYETANAQYCQFLNAAKASGLVTVYNDGVYAVSDTSHSEIYLELYSGSSPYSQITYSGGTFSIRSRDGYSMDNHPVVEVSWYGATAFCNYYSWRLPTEWEWQAVADYDGSYTYGSGTTIDHSKANYDLGNPLNLSSYPYTSPVGHYPPYGYGMCDMAGNVWEWTSTVSGSFRVLRGGSWNYGDSTCTVSSRGNNYPYDAFGSIGFRVCR